MISNHLCKNINHFAKSLKSLNQVLVLGKELGQIKMLEENVRSLLSATSQAF